MTSINTTTLQAIATVGFEDFKNAWITGGITGNDVASRYYRELKQQGTVTGNQNIVNYAQLAGQVAAYSGVNGVIANEFSQVVAGKYGVDFSVGSDNWLEMQYTLMQEDFRLRQRSVDANGTGELDFQGIMGAHGAAFDAIGLPPEAFSLYTPLSQVAQYDPAKAQLMFAGILPGDGILDVLKDGLFLGFGTGISTQQDIDAILRDYGNKAVWMGAVFRVLKNLVGDVPYPGDTSELTDLLDKYGGFSDIAGLLFFGLADWPSIAKDYGWALHNPGAMLGELPEWVQGALSPLVETPGRVPGYPVNPVSPLVLDMNGDGAINLVSLDNSTVNFDFWSDGFAERTGWVAPGDGFLVRDLDNDGAIEGVAEMFGSNYPLGYLLSGDWPTFRDEENGFAKLELLDSNGDGIISALDTAWSTLKIWQDVNQDGISQPEELKTLGALNIASIDVAGAELDSWYGVLGGGFHRKIEGNTISHTSSFTLGDGTSREIVDAWFVLDLMNSRFSEDYTLDMRTLFLPTLRGYGTLPDLHVAMSQNTALLDKVVAFVTTHATMTSLFTDFAAVRTSAADILKTWAGITGPEAGYDHGAFGKMPEYLFLQKLTGIDSPYLGSWFDGTDYMPWPADGVSAIFQAWNHVLDGLTARLLFQSGAQEIFQSGVSYNPVTDTFDGTLRLDQAAIDALKTAAATQTDKEGFWHNVAAFVDSMIGRTNLTTTETAWLTDAVNVSSGGALNWSGILHTLDPNVIAGTDGNDSKNGTRWNDVMGENSPAGGGNDSFYGKDGDDTLYGGDGDDYLSGGKGNDILYGGKGNDIYFYDYGHDVIVEIGGNNYLDTDVIRFSSAISQTAVSLHMANLGQDFTGHLFLEIEGRGTIIIQDDGAWWSPNSQLIDRLEFASGIQVTFQNSDISVHGTQGDDSLGGFGYTGLNKIYGYGGNDSIWSNSNDINNFLDGGEGNDTFSIGKGNDTYLFSPGTDTVEDFGGADTILIPAGYTLDDIRFLRTEGSGGYYNATIVVNGLGSMVLKDQFLSSAPTGKSVETLLLADGTSVDLMSRAYEVQGTDGNDSFRVDSSSWLIPQNNIYHFGKGQDGIFDNSGQDTVRFAPGVTASDIIFYRTAGDTSLQRGPGYYDLVIKDSLGNSLTNVYHFYGSEGSNALETLSFADGTIINLLGIEIEARGTEGNDQIKGVSVGDLSPNDTIYGYGGNDQLIGEDGDDVLDGGAGEDYLYGGDGNDTLYGSSGNDVLYGDDGDDVLDGGAGDDRIYGGAGTDTVSYGSASAAVTVSLVITSSQNTGGGGVDLLSAVENITGSNFNDTLTGDSGANVIDGGSGNDILNGGGGVDTIAYRTASTAVTVNLSLTAAQNTGGSGTDTLSGFENLTGSGFNDVLNGDSGANVIDGGSGSDTLNGSAGNDTLYGGTGNDLITGGAGIDILYGNEGADRFKFVVSGMDGSVDAVSDFSLAQNDKLHIKDLLIGFDPLTKFITDFVQIADSGSNSILSVDRDGTAGAYGMTQIALLQGVTGLTDEAALFASGNIIAT